MITPPYAIFFLMVKPMNRQTSSPMMTAAKTGL
jgi:hypothetical protein